MCNKKHALEQRPFSVLCAVFGSRTKENVFGAVSFNCVFVVLVNGMFWGLRFDGI